jgi:peroxiredoxin
MRRTLTGRYGSGIAALAILMALAVGCGSDEKTDRTKSLPKVTWAIHDRPAPDFELLEHGVARTLRLSSERGRIVLLNFCGVQSKASREELPELMAIHHAFTDSGVSVIGVLKPINPTKHAETDTLVSKLGIPYRLLTGTRDVMIAYRMNSVPMGYLIDRDGIVRNRYIGPKSRDEYARDIHALLRR